MFVFSNRAKIPYYLIDNKNMFHIYILTIELPITTEWKNI